MDESKFPMNTFPIMGMVVGPFRAKDPNNHWEVEENIRKAEELLLKLWQNGVPAICPHTNTRFFQGAAPDHLWLQGYQYILSKMGFVICVEGWEASSGSIGEVNLAEELGITVYYSINILLDDLNKGKLKKKCCCSTADLDMRDKHGQAPD